MKIRSVSIFLIGSLSGMIQAVAQTSIGIIGGGALDPSTLNYSTYAALIAADGTLVPLFGPGFPPFPGFIDCVALNSSRFGIIGGGTEGNETASGFAALVAPDGTLTPLSGGGFPFNGDIEFVAINNSGFGIIGGNYYTGTEPAYAALVAPDGTLTQLSGGSFPSVAGLISAVAINNSGVGIIGGGSIAGAAYGALVASNGTLTEFSGGNFPSVEGFIQDVAINNSGVGIIGGRGPGPNFPAYAALVAPDGTLTQLSGGGFPLVQGIIFGVGINNSGVGLIAGNGQGSSGNSAGYAALVAPNGTLTQLFGGGLNVENNTSLFDAAINNSGAGIIGGGVCFNDICDTDVAYAALVAPDGTVTRLTSLSSLLPDGPIEAVAINDAGIGLIGGESLLDIVDFNGGPLFVALVAPNGTLTQLFGPGFPSIGAIGDEIVILDAATPTSIGPYAAPLTTLLAASLALESHQMIFHKQFCCCNERNYNKNCRGTDDQKRKYDKSCRDKTSEERSPFTIWASPFYNNTHQKGQGEIPAYRNKIVGGIAGLDYWANNNIVIGGGLAYAFDRVQYSKHLGHAKIEEGMAVCYTSYQSKYVFADVSVWGGYYHLHNKRRMLGFITSKSNTHGWLLSPHVELCVTNYDKWKGFVIEPFVMADWVNGWQKHFTEHGSSGFNLVVGGQYHSLLRSETGVRFYETFRYHWGCFLLEEKMSYINRKPFDFDSKTVVFIDSDSKFSIDTGSDRVANLAGVEISASLVPWNKNWPYGKIDLQGEFGSSFQSYFASFEIGKYF